MMAAGHSSFNLAVGLGIGDALALPPAATITLGLASAGAGLLPDVDCAGSTAATVFGPFSEFAHDIAIQLHHMVSASISTDGHEHGAHRGLTHWWPFWVVCGLGVEIGCLASKWAAMGVLAVLFALAARGLTIPDLPAETQGRFDDSLRHHVMMKIAYGMLNLNPFTLCMRRARKHVAKSRRYGWWIFTVRFGVGKVATAAGALGLAWYLTTIGVVVVLAPWLGLIVGAGMLLHWVGDSPTHMGVPGAKLHQVWKLPFWASFYAGGPFEIIMIWFTLGWLNVLLIPGLLGHNHQMTLLFWMSIVVGSLIALAILIEGTSQVSRRRYAS
jgi:hypothetical protein